MQSKLWDEIVVDNFAGGGGAMNKVKFNHTAHKELWNWLAENPLRCKPAWPGWEDNGGKYYRIHAHCFACEYSHILCEDEDGHCKHCPFDWGEDDNCEVPQSLWNKWCDTRSVRTRTLIAEKIRDLPVKEGVECI